MEPGFGGAFGFSSEQSGYQPATTTGWAGGFTGSPGAVVEGGEDYLDDEERERVEAVLAANEDRKRQLFAK